MQDIEILIRYKCEKCDGSGALRQEGSNRVIGNCRDCGGQGNHQEWRELKVVLNELVESSLADFW